MAKSKVAPKEEPKSKSKAPVKAKVEAPKLEKVNVTAKQIGKNLNVIVGNEKITRIGTKEELQVVKDAISKYTDLPTKGNYEAMMRNLRPVTTENEKKEEQVKAEIKGTKKKIEEKSKEVKTKKSNITDVVKDIDDKVLSDEEIKSLEAALARGKEKKQAQPVSKTTERPYSGEAYRRR